MNTLPEQIERITRLLNCYYDGTATPAEVEAIADFFKSADRSQLPENLRDEAAVFALLDTGCNALADDVPAGLAESIMATIDAAETKSRRGKRKAVIIRFAGWLSTAAAVVAVVICFSGRIADNPADYQNEPLSVDGMAHISPVTATSVDEAVDEVDAVTVTTDVKEVRHESVAQAEQIHDNYIEITDPIEASMLTQDVLALIGEKIALAGNTVREVNHGLKHVDNTLRDVMAVEPVHSTDCQYTRIINSTL